VTERGVPTLPKTGEGWGSLIREGLKGGPARQRAGPLPTFDWSTRMNPSTACAASASGFVPRGISKQKDARGRVSPERER
jgi:hypothetical protein